MVKAWFKNLPNPSHMSQHYFFFKTNGRMKRIDYADILCLETANNYTRFHTAKGPHMVRIPLKQALQELKDKRFVQVHRFYAMSVDNIDTIDRECIVSVNKPDTTIPFNKKYLQKLLEQIKILGPQSDYGDDTES